MKSLLAIENSLKITDAECQTELVDVLLDSDWETSSCSSVTENATSSAKQWRMVKKNP